MDPEIFRNLITQNEGIEQFEEQQENILEFAKGIAVRMGVDVEEFFELPEEVRIMIYRAFFVGCDFERDRNHGK